MARPLRIEYPGALYHITSRGNARLPIFEDDHDRRMFLNTLEEVVKRYNWLCHAYCLMDNHYHLLLQTVDGVLSLGMRHLNGVFTQRFNRRIPKLRPPAPEPSLSITWPAAAKSTAIYIKT